MLRKMIAGNGSENAVVKAIPAHLLNTASGASRLVISGLGSNVPCACSLVCKFVSYRAEPSRVSSKLFNDQGRKKRGSSRGKDEPMEWTHCLYVIQDPRLQERRRRSPKP